MRYEVVDHVVYAEDSGGVQAFRAEMIRQGCIVVQDHPWALVSGAFEGIRNAQTGTTLYVARHTYSIRERWAAWARHEYSTYHVRIAPRSTWPAPYWVEHDHVYSTSLHGLQRWIDEMRAAHHWLSTSQRGLLIPQYEPLHAHHGLTLYTTTEPFRYTLCLAERSVERES